MRMTDHVFTVIVLCCVFGVSNAETLRLSTDEWRADLKFLANELPKRHANAFHHTSREQFESAVAKLDQNLTQLDAAQIYIGMVRIVNSVGDAHTYLRSPTDNDSFPLRIARFGKDYRVAQSAPELTKALGTRAVKINGTPIERVRDEILTITPQDETAYYQEALASSWMTIGIILHGLGVTPVANTAEFTFADDTGQEFSIALHSASKAELQPVYTNLALFRQRPGETFWYTWLPESRTVYCNFRGYKDLGKLAKGLFAMVKEKHPERLVIDLRQNGGGDYIVGLFNLVRPIRDLTEINQKGHLFVIIGPNTFSAAMSNAAHFRNETAAILVGRPIGEKPNSYQEPRECTLPNSGLTLRYSTKYYEFVKSGDNVIRPDQEVETPWLDFKDGRDPVLEWILAYRQ